MSPDREVATLAQLAIRFGRLLGRPTTADHILSEGIEVLAASLPLAQITGLVATAYGWREIPLATKAAPQNERGRLSGGETGALLPVTEKIPTHLLPMRRVLPLQEGDTTYALLDFYPLRPLTEEEEELLQTVSTALAAGLSGAPTNSFDAAVNRFYAALMQADKAETGRETMDAIVQFAQASGWQRAVFSQRDPATLQGVATAMVGLTEDEQRDLIEKPTAPEIWRLRLSPAYDHVRTEGWYHLRASEDVTLSRVPSIPSRQVPLPYSQWHPSDLLFIPARGATGDLIGILALDDPMDGQGPTVARMRPLQIFVQHAARRLEVILLREQVERRRVATRVLQEMGTIATSGLDTPTICHMLVELLVSQLDFSHIAIFLHTGGRFQCVASHGYDDPRDLEAPNRSDGLVGRTIRLREQQSHQGASESAQPDDGTTELALPLMRGDRVEGVVMLRGTPEKPLSPEDRELTEALASEIERSLRTTHFLQKVERASLLVRAVREASRQVASILNVDQLLGEVVGLICQELGCYHVHLLTADGENRWRIRAASGHAAKEMLAAAYGVSSDQGVAGIVAATGYPLFVSDVSTSDQYVPTSYLTDTASELAVPLRLGTLVLGVLDVRSDRVGDFTSDDVSVIETIASQVAVALNNAQLFDALEVQLQERAQLYRASSALLSADSEQAVLSAMLTVPTSPHLSHAWLLMESEGDSGRTDGTPPAPLEMVASWAATGEPARINAALVGRWLHKVGPLSQERRSLSLPTTKALPPTLHAQWVALGAASAVILPLSTGGRFVGATVLLLSDPEPPTDSDLRFLTALTDQAATALDRLRLMTQAQRRAEGLTALTDMAHAVVSSLDLSHTLEESVAAMAKLLRVKQSGVLLFEPEHGRSRLAAQYREDGYRHPGEVYFPLTENPLSAELMRTHKPIYIRDIEDDPLALLIRESGLQRSYHAILVLPLLTRGQLIGSISLDVLDDREFTQEEIRLAQAMADQIAAAIVNSQLYGEATTRAQMMEIASQSGQFLTRANNEAQLQQEVVEFLTDRFDLAFVGFYVPDAEQPRRLLLGAGTGKVAAILREQRHVLWTGQGLVGKVLAHGRAIVSNRVDDEDRISYPLIGRTASQAALPLLAGGELLGVLSLHSDDATFFSGPALAALETVVSDVTIALQTARLLSIQRRSLRELEALDAMKSEFLATMSHELRTPLNSIIGFAKVMLRGINGPINDKQKEDITLIYNSGQQLLGIINDILDLTKILAGKMELFIKPTNMKTLLEEMVQMMTPEAQEHHLSLDISIEEPLPLVAADPLRVRQLVLNLLSNAIKFTDKGGVWITARRVSEQRPPAGGVGVLALPMGGYVEIAVRDTGIGIRQENIEKIFEEFRQISRNDRRSTSGAGLGLAISRRFAEMHGGALWVESHYGIGSVFRVTLPIFGDAPDTITAAESRP